MKKNILFIGPYRQRDGWGFAARDYIRALAKTRHNISCKPIFLGKPNSGGLHPTIMQKEKVQFEGRPDIIIQNALPPYLDYQHGMKNIALCYVETRGLQYTSWIAHLNLMDEVWVASNNEKDILLTDGVKVPIKIVPMPFDYELIDSYTEKWPIAYGDSTCIFYTIAEYSERKNIQALIVAFYNEFFHTEPAQLLLKLHKPGLSEENLYKLLAQDIVRLKKRLRNYGNEWGYPEILLAIQNLSPQHLISVHNCGDCFVMPSRGESLCRPVMDAMYVGNDVIVTADTGMDVWGNCSHGVNKVSSQAQSVQVNYPPLSYLYTGRETWQDISIPELQKAMRTSFNSWVENPSKQKREWMKKQYSYEAIAKRIEEVL